MRSEFNEDTIRGPYCQVFRRNCQMRIRARFDPVIADIIIPETTGVDLAREMFAIKNRRADHHALGT